jgi:hypothetical protein
MMFTKLFTEAVIKAVSEQKTMAEAIAVVNHMVVCEKSKVVSKINSLKKTIVLTEVGEMMTDKAIALCEMELQELDLIKYEVETMAGIYFPAEPEYEDFTDFNEERDVVEDFTDFNPAIHVEEEEVFYLITDKTPEQYDKCQDCYRCPVTGNATCDNTGYCDK